MSDDAQPEDEAVELEVGLVGPDPQLDAPRHPPTAPQQHVASAPQPGAGQHSGGVAEPATQRPADALQSPSAQHADGLVQGPEPQHAGGIGEGPGPQHSTPPVEPGPQHAPSGVTAGPQHAASPLQPGPQHAAPDLSPGRGPWGKLRHLRAINPRRYVAIVTCTGVAAVTIAGVAVFTATQTDDPPNRITAATEAPTTAESTTGVAPVVTTAGSTGASVTIATVAPAPVATDAPTTTVSATTTEAPTTTLAPSFAGTYTVQLADEQAGSGPLVPGPAGQPQAWTFTGPCDGVAACTLTNGAVEVPQDHVSPFSGQSQPIVLTATGNGDYSGSFPFDDPDCKGTQSVTATFTAGATGSVAVGGTFAYTLNGGQTCSNTVYTFTSTYTGVMA
ncbi:MAG: hypothetical protein JWN39_1098 [Ilumatobacteraceae bacterium]|nr:hypothetical protein [Ilumatobacteraceae bacterium]